MRKSFVFLFSFFIVYTSANSQEAVFKITKSYFRSNPFRGEFSSFLKHLLDDPTLSNKIMERRTDSTLFYFQGTYNASNYNPFFFKPKRLQVVLTEVAVDLDSTVKDTIFVYELLAYNDDTKKGGDEIRKEFDKILKRYKGSFSKNEYKEYPPEHKVRGGVYNFFDRYHAVSPFALALYGPDGNKELCMVLTIRLDTYANVAMLASPYNLGTDLSTEEQ